MLSSSKVLICRNNRKLQLFDKNLDNKITEIDLGGNNDTGFFTKAFDEERQKLWLHIDNVIHCYDVSDTAISESFTVDVGGHGQNSSFDIDKNTGNLYFIRNGSTSARLFKINLENKAVESTIDISKPHETYVTFKKNNYFDASVGGNYRYYFHDHIDVLVKDDGVYVFLNLQINIAREANNSLITKCNLDLTQKETFVHCFDLSNNQAPVFSNSDVGVNYEKYTKIHPITKDIFCLRRQTFGTPALFVFSKNSDIKHQVILNKYINPNDFAEYKYLLFIGEKTGTIFVVNINLGILLIFDLFLNLIDKVQVPTNSIFSFDKYSEVLYARNNNSSTTYIISNTGDIVKSFSDNYGVKFFEVLGSDVDSVYNYIGSSKIIEPAPESKITDTTPTVIFKVGKNPAGWTQQFRVVADTDETKIVSGEATDTYARTFDSWANGENYKDCTWEYTTNYNDANPTWTALGTGDGLKSNGSEPDNGVDNSDNSKQYFVRMTIPDADALTGFDTNTTWYFKVFSYSKN